MMRERANTFQLCVAAILTGLEGCGETAEDQGIQLANEELQSGLAIAQGGDHDLAIACFSEAIRLNPECWRAYQERACSRLLKQPIDFDSAVRDLTVTIEASPTARAYTLRGYAFLGTDQTDQAIADLSEAIRIDPSMHSAWMLRGVAYLQTGDEEQANHDLQFARGLRESGWSSGATIWPDIQVPR